MMDTNAIKEENKMMDIDVIRVKEKSKKVKKKEKK